MTPQYRLYGAPRPLVAESANSYLQRLAHRYDLKFPALKRSLGLDWDEDVDLQLDWPAFQRIAAVCGVPQSDYSLMYWTLSRIGGNPTLRPFLLFDSVDRPRYRFCRECWRGDHTPYCRIEWRFQHWTACPRHCISLAETCASCSEPWPMHRALLSGGRSRAHSLAHCTMCGADQRIARQLLEAGTAEEIQLGRAVVSAVAQGHADLRKGASCTRISLVQLLRLVEDDACKPATQEQPPVTLVIDRTPTIGRERQLALWREGKQPGHALPALDVQYRRYSLARSEA